MATQVQRRKGTTVQHSTFTGASAELTVDTTKNTVVVHDGATAGGFPLAKDSEVAHLTGAETVAGVKTLSSNPILSAGTANGVTYLNGSKALTSGSALTFDGTNLGVGGTASAKVDATGTNRIQLRTDDTVPEVRAITANGSAFKELSLNALELRFNLSNIEQMRLTSTGLGIGTSSPSQKLTVVGNGVFSGGYVNTGGGGNGLRVDGVILGDRDQNNNITLIGGSDNTLQLRTGSTAKATLDSSGNLGIGTSSPGEKLDVRSSGNAIGNFQSSNASGYAGINAINGSRSWYAGIRADASNGFGIRDETAGATRLLIDSSGNLGLGVTPSAWSLGKAVEVGFLGNGVFSPSQGVTNIVNNTYYSSSAYRYATTAAAAYYSVNSGLHQWYTAPSGTAGAAITFTQAMTLDVSGNLLVGTTSVIQLGKQSISYLGATQRGLSISGDVSTSQAAIAFVNPNGIVGTVTTNGSATAYNTSSDYRLKNSIAPITGALAKVASLKPVTYKWNSDGSDGEGFIAHELAEICPAAVTGEKDAVDAEGNPQYQGIDVSFLVGTLTAAIQELKAEFDAYKASHP